VQCALPRARTSQAAISLTVLLYGLLSGRAHTLAWRQLRSPSLPCLLPLHERQSTVSHCAIATLRKHLCADGWSTYALSVMLLLLAACRHHT
jgi:hypothetical protein